MYPEMTGLPIGGQSLGEKILGVWTRNAASDVLPVNRRLGPGHFFQVDLFECGLVPFKVGKAQALAGLDLVEV